MPGRELAPASTARSWIEEEGLARDKRTRRAEARRKYREQMRTQQEQAPNGDPEDAPAAAELGRGQSLIGSIASSFTMPDLRGDLRALPAIATRTWAFALPLAAIALTFLVALDENVFFRRIQPGEPLSATAARLLYEFVLIPGAGMSAVFVGAVLAPRAGWLVGGIVGVVGTAAFLILLGIHGPPDYFVDGNGVPIPLSPIVALQTLATYLPIYVFLGAFAGWYRRFLMSMQARTRQRAEERRREQARQTRRARTAAARR